MSLAQSTGIVSRQYGAHSSPFLRALDDLRRGVTEWRLWVSFGWLDVKQRYRRAVLGPFWITISMCVLIMSLGVLYAGIFRLEVSDFLPYIAAGFIVWFYFSGTVTESTTAFVLSEGLIKHGGIPLSLHVFRSVFRNLVVGAHNLTVMLLVYVWQPHLLNWNTLLFIPGLVLMLANLVWISFIVGILCTRFRDLPPIVVSLLQICLFISPVMYRASVLPPHLTFVIELNPLYYFIEVLRAPLLGIAPSIKVYVVMFLFALVGSALSFRMFQVTRPRIAYWL